VLTAITLVAGALFAYSWWQVATIKTFSSEITPIAPTSSDSYSLITTAKSTETFLLFSVGSEGIDLADGDRLGIGKKRAAMADGLTDSIMLVIANPVTRRIGVVSIPRDTWLEDRGHRVNESFNRHGLTGFISDISTLTGVEVNHAISVNFAAFADITDAVGGVEIKLPYPVRDAKAKLDLSSGCVRLTGSQALAFVRSRNWQVYTNGSWRSDATSSDWGRIERQQAFIRLILSKVVSPELPIRIPALVKIAGDNLTIDAGLTVSVLLSWAKAYVKGVDMLAATTIPGRGFTTEAGASVIGVDPTAARETVKMIIGKLEENENTGSIRSESESNMKIESSEPLYGSQSYKKPNDSIQVQPDSVEPTSEKEVRKETQSPWKPDTGLGEGGLRFTSCD
jgi:LCP family protein required for cell wall assembly